ncbi:MAG: hypothetical protein LBC04_02410 [Holosporaceae bacterium]|nr:hypothetical protein [Holosporaceae bacterium]
MKYIRRDYCSWLFVIFFACNVSPVFSMGFNIAIDNELENPISISKVPPQEVTAIPTGAIVQGASGEVVLPSIEVRESISLVINDSKETILINHGEITELFIILTGLDLSKINITEDPFFIQRLAVKSGGTDVGYISFRCSMYNTNPVITMESEDKYLISEKQMLLGGGGIHIVVKKKY